MFWNQNTKKTRKGSVDAVHTQRFSYNPHAHYHFSMQILTRTKTTKIKIIILNQKLTKLVNLPS